jgi:hypothetical protein
MSHLHASACLCASTTVDALGAVLYDYSIISCKWHPSTRHHSTSKNIPTSYQAAACSQLGMSSLHTHLMTQYEASNCHHSTSRNMPTRPQAAAS